MARLAPLAVALTVLVGVPLLQGCATTKSERVGKKPKRAKKPPRLAGDPSGREAVADPGDDSASVSDDDLDSRPGDLSSIAMSEGVGSYYHDSLAGRLTANGEKYNPEARTCAHKTLKFGTVVIIEDVDTGRSVRCRVNDRGPFVSGRVIDMSRRVARELGVLERGLARVRLRIAQKPGA